MSLMDDNPSQDRIIPDYILLSIFEHLNSAVDLGNAGLVCRSWHRVSHDQLLWKRLLCSYWSIPFKSVSLPNENSCWKDEYVRLVYHAPIHEAQKLTSHTDQVLHVSFSHNGLLFSSCSKDSHVKVWNSTHPVSLHHDVDMSVLRWKYSQFSQFNDSDTLLLVSGILSRSRFTGEIAVFSLKDEFILQCKIQNNPDDVFGAWYNDSYFISASINRSAESASSPTTFWLNCAFLDMESRDQSVAKQLLYTFDTEKTNSICSVTLANCAGSSSQTSSTNPNDINGETENDASCSENYFSIGSSDEWDEDNDYEVLADQEKYLIFSTGSQPFISHEIGFKRVKPVRFKRKISLDSKNKSGKGELENNNDRPSPNGSDESQVQEIFDKIDHRIDLESHIIGMTLSPDHKFLYVNCRPWSDPDDPYDFLPPFLQETNIHVIDLTTLKKVGTVYSSPKTFTANNECFFIFPNVSDNYLASGAVDNYGYLWDRHYKVLVSKLDHSDVVNSVAFNKRDEEMLISASDDFSIKVWRSKCSLRTIPISTKADNRQIYLEQISSIFL